MTFSDISLVQPKENLENILGSNSSQYWKTTRLWYKSQISKDEFNKVAKELLGETNIHVHNEFVLALLLKCQQSHRGFKRGVPHSINGACPENQGHMLVKKRALEARVLPGRGGLAAQDRVLPDEDTITSRCLTGAWEQNIDEVNINVVPLLKSALQMYMQKILTDCTKVCKSYHMDEHNIPFGFNQPHPTDSVAHLPSLIVLSRRNEETTYKMADCSCEERNASKTNITIPHLIQVLHKLKSKKIGLMNIERAQCLQTTKQRNPHTKLVNSTLNKIQYKNNTLNSASELTVQYRSTVT
ncbi:hypothetical protein ACHWQZ_G012362 [Mnemiopsis leidyi]